MAIGVAIIGAGNFARYGHLPAIQESPKLTLKAVYSLTQEAAETVANGAGIDAYYDEPPSLHSLNALFARDDVQAVTIALPIYKQPEIILKALKAGKHVLSEKPIAKDVHTAEKLLNDHRTLKGSPLWSVGENFRFMEPMLWGFAKLKEHGVTVETFTVKLHNLIDEDDKSFKTTWRQNPQHQGGFLLDGGIHVIAALRFLCAACEVTITGVAAFTCLLQPNLKPSDTANATIQLDNENSGTLSLSYGTEFAHVFEIEIITKKGRLTVTPSRAILVSQGPDGTELSTTKDFGSDTSVRRELEVFAIGIERGKLEDRSKPEEALMDLRILQAILESGNDNGATKIVEQL